MLEVIKDKAGWVEYIQGSWAAMFSPGLESRFFYRQYGTKVSHFDSPDDLMALITVLQEMHKDWVGGVE